MVESAVGDRGVHGPSHRTPAEPRWERAHISRCSVQLDEIFAHRIRKRRATEPDLVETGANRESGACEGGDLHG